MYTNSDHLNRVYNRACELLCAYCEKAKSPFEFFFVCYLLLTCFGRTQIFLNKSPSYFGYDNNSKIKADVVYFNKDGDKICVEFFDVGFHFYNHATVKSIIKDIEDRARILRQDYEADKVYFVLTGRWNMYLKRLKKDVSFIINELDKWGINVMYAPAFDYKAIRQGLSDENFAEMFNQIYSIFNFLLADASKGNTFKPSMKALEKAFSMMQDNMCRMSVKKYFEDNKDVITTSSEYKELQKRTKLMKHYTVPYGLIRNVIGKDEMRKNAKRVHAMIEEESTKVISLPTATEDVMSWAAKRGTKNVVVKKNTKK